MNRPGAQLDSVIASLLDDRKTLHRLRQLAISTPLDATHVEIDGQKFVNFSSNNYLGLSRHPKLVAAVESALRQYGFGSGAAALICGYSPLHASAERSLASWKGTEAAILLPSGYQANHAAVQTLAAMTAPEMRPVRFLIDKLVHASILDAVAATGHTPRVFPHNNLNKLKRLLAGSNGNVLDVVITESIFSMDGDAADLTGLARLKSEHPFVLMLDEAHAGGLYGPAGAGYAHELGLQATVDVSIVTLSKALGGIGGAICASRLFCAAVANFGRAFIYSTSLPPAAAAAAEAALQIVRDEPQRQKRVREIALRVRCALMESGINVLPGDSPIICVVMGSEESCLAAAEELRRGGFLVAAVRPPTVASGSSRLRITLCCDHTDEELNQLIAAITKIQCPAPTTPPAR